MARRRSSDDGCCLGFPIILWAVFTHLTVVPAVADATGIKAGPALFIAVFLVTPVQVFVAALLLYALILKAIQWVGDAFRN